jgi:N-acetylneuraminic acid mutarotase
VAHEFFMQPLPLAVLGISDSNGQAVAAQGPVDFGHVMVGSTRTLELKLHNSGNIPLLLEAPQVTSPWSSSAGGATVEPGATLSLPLTFLPQSFGEFSTTLLLRSNDRLRPILALTLRGSGGQSQSIFFEPIANSSCGDLITPIATASSGLPISWTVTAGASLVQWEGASLRLQGAGTVTLEASQMGDDQYGAVTLSRTFEVLRVPQTLSWTPTLPTSVFWQTPVPIAAASTRAGLIPTISVVSGPGIYSNGLLTFNGKGTVVLRASHAGDSTTLPATLETNIVARDAVLLAALSSSFQLQMNDALRASLRCNNLAELAEPISFHLLSGPAHGGLTLDSSSGWFEYLPEPGYEGLDSFRFQCSQIGVTSNIAEVNLLVSSKLANWAWMSGSMLTNAKAITAAPGDSLNPNSNPGARSAAAHWRDRQGSFLLFGGYGYAIDSNPGLLADLWRWDPTTAKWSLLIEAPQINQARVLPSVDQLNVESPSLTPGGRSEAQFWNDASGDLWIFGGLGTDVGGKAGLMADLWRLNIQSRHWACVKSAVLNQVGSASAPSARSAGSCWSDPSSGDLLLFGGRGCAPSGSSIGVLNDLWRFDRQNLQWTNLGGNRELNGVGLSSGSNAWPQARSHAALWQGLEGNLYLFGGLDSKNAPLNDLWLYEPALHRWTLLRTPPLKMQPSLVAEMGVAGATDWPGNRSASTTWRDAGGRFWMFGGSGLGANASMGVLADVWRFDPITLRWACMKGPLSVGSAPVYGALTAASAGQSPGARCQAAGWADDDGKLWVMGGRNLSKFFADGWRLNLPALPGLESCSVSLASTDEQQVLHLSLQARVRTQGMNTRLFWRIGQLPDLGDAQLSEALEISANPGFANTSQSLNWPQAQRLYVQACAENAAGTTRSAIQVLQTSPVATEATLDWQSTSMSVQEASWVNGTMVPGVLRAVLTLDQPASQPIRVRVVVSGEANLPNKPLDFLAPASEVSFIKGQQQATYEVLLTDDAQNEATESLILTLADPEGPARLGINARLTATLLDNDMAPSIAVQPQSKVLNVGDAPVVLTAEIAGGTPPLLWQWYKNGTLIPTAKGPALTLPSAAASAGSYDLVIRNATGSVTANRAHVCLLQMGTTALSAKVGAAVALKLTTYTPPPTLAGTAPQSTWSYQWYRIAGDTRTAVGTLSSTLNFPSLSSLDAGVYACMFQYGAVAGQSQPCLLQVVDAVPVIAAPGTLRRGQVGQAYAHNLQLENGGGQSASGFSATGLPTGLAIDSRGQITGRPSVAVINRSVSFTARNAWGISRPVTAAITIDPLPAQQVGSYIAVGQLAAESMRLDLSITAGAQATVKCSTMAGSVSASAVGDLDPDDGRLKIRCSIKPAGQSAASLLDLSVSNDELIGQWLDASTLEIVGEVRGYRMVWNTLRSAKHLAGYHNLVMLASPSMLGDLDLPQGAGYAGFNVAAPSSALSLAGRDALGSTLTAASFIGGAGQLAIWSSNSTAATRLYGQLEFTQTPIDANAPNPISGNLLWQKSGLNSVSHRTYRRGFAVQNLLITGGRYRAPGPGSVLLDLPNHVTNNALLRLEQGGLSPVDLPLTINNPSTTLQKISFSPNSFAPTLSVNSLTGFFNGSFSITQDNLKRIAPFSGMIVPTAEGSQAWGGFLLPELPQPGETLLTSPILSGQVRLLANPR